MARRVLIELPSFDRGGLQKVVLDVAIGLKTQGYTSLIVTTGPLGQLSHEAQEAGIQVQKLSAHQIAQSYPALLEEFRPTVAQAHFSDAGYPYLAAAGVPILCFIHNVYAFLPQTIRQAFRDGDRFVARYIAVSRKAADYAIANLCIDPNKIEIVANGLDFSKYPLDKPGALTRAQLGIDGNEYVFLNPASYNLHKGHYLMAAAMKRVLSERQDVRILCVGNEIHSPHVEALKSYLLREGLDQHILMPGYYEDIADPMNISDAFLLPSFIEGWSIAMNEAMHYAKPMILTNTGGAAEVIENGDVGILLPTEYPNFLTLDSAELDRLAYSPQPYQLAEPLARAMLDFATRREHWREAGLRGQAKLHERHSFARVLERYRDIMDRLAASPSIQLAAPSSKNPPDRPSLGRQIERQVRRLLHSVRDRYKPALSFWLGNHLFMNWMPYRVKHAFLRRFCHVRIGKDSTICSSCFITGFGVQIGSNTVINRFCYLDGRVPLKIGNNVNVSHYTLIQTLTHDPQNPDFVCIEGPVEIGDHAWIGARAIICPGVKIGEGAVVGAGAVVTRNVEPY